MGKLSNFLIDHKLDKKNQVRVPKTSKVEIVDFIKRIRPLKSKFELIRIGPNGDGGYLAPNDLKGIEACFSPGVDTISEFEKDCIERFNMKVFMADKSVDRPNLDMPDDSYDFQKKFIGCTNNEDYITLDQWVSSSLPESNADLLLQMDIEGGEFFSLINASNALVNRFRIMVIEFHDLHELWNRRYFELAPWYLTRFSFLIMYYISIQIIIVGRRRRMTLKSQE